jgi:hypothetical protein
VVNSLVGVVYRGYCDRAAALAISVKLSLEFYGPNCSQGFPTIRAPRLYSVLPIRTAVPQRYNFLGTGSEYSGLTFRAYSGDEMRFGPFLVIALLLLVVWAGGFLMFHLASGLIHLLLLFAVISFVAHLVLGNRPA